MKTIFFFIAVLLSWKLYTQEWFPTGATWHYSITDPFIPGMNPFNKLEILGDTTIQGKNCKILSRSEGTCNLRPDLDYIYEEDEQVYYYEQLTDSFYLLYDFSKEPGESWETPLMSMPDHPDTMVFMVNSIGFESINGNNVRVLNVSKSTRVGWFQVSGGNRILEFIGDEGDLFPWFWYGCDWWWNSGLRCYEDEYFGLYMTGLVPECEFTSVGLNESYDYGNRLKVMPNPVCGSFRIFSNDGRNSDNLYLAIFNLLGKQMSSMTVLPPYNIDIEHLDPGMCFLNVYDSRQEISVIKIVKN